MCRLSGNPCSKIDSLLLVLRILLTAVLLELLNAVEFSKKLSVFLNVILRYSGYLSYFSINFFSVGFTPQSESEEPLS